MNKNVLLWATAATWPGPENMKVMWLTLTYLQVSDSSIQFELSSGVEAPAVVEGEHVPRLEEMGQLCGVCTVCVWCVWHVYVQLNCCTFHAIGVTISSLILTNIFKYDWKYLQLGVMEQGCQAVVCLIVRLNVLLQWEIRWDEGSETGRAANQGQLLVVQASKLTSAMKSGPWFCGLQLICATLGQGESTTQYCFSEYKI